MPQLRAPSHKERVLADCDATLSVCMFLAVKKKERKEKHETVPLLHGKESQSYERPTQMCAEPQRSILKKKYTEATY